MAAARTAQPQGNELQATATLHAGLAETAERCFAIADGLSRHRRKVALAETWANDRAAGERAAYARGPTGPQRQPGPPRQLSGPALGTAPSGDTAYKYCADFQRGGPSACTRGGRCRHFHGHPPK
jgi:hypothetical protein